MVALLLAAATRVTAQTLRLMTGSTSLRTAHVYSSPRPTAHVSDAVRSGGLRIDSGPRQPRLGIAAGTWIPVWLLHGVGSSDPGWAEFRARVSTVGRYGVLPAGTLLFATKSYNAAVERIEFTVVKAVLSSGHTQKMHGLVCDLAHRAGLPVFDAPRARNRRPVWQQWLQPLRQTLHNSRALSWLPRGSRSPTAASINAYVGAQPALVEILSGF